jgi:hypothetical protein
VLGNDIKNWLNLFLEGNWEFESYNGESLFGLFQCDVSSKLLANATAAGETKTDALVVRI